MDDWAKTILSVYKYLEKIANAVDNLIRKKCIYSSFANNRTDIYSQTDNIITLMNKKINLINLKVITEQALLAMRPKERQIIMLSYVDGVSSSKIAECLNMSMRSYFRQKCNAVHNFACKLKMLGYTDAKLSEKYGSEVWLNRVYNRACKFREDCTQEYSQVQFVNSVVREYSGNQTPYYNYI